MTTPKASPWRSWPLPSGRFRDLARHLDRLRKLNLRVYLPCDHADNLASLRILSSVGIPCCADFRDGGTDWEALADLATYAVLERTPHAAMEPFAFMAANYHSADRLDWGRVFFDDPRHFLHLSEDGRVALSQAELAEGRFVAPASMKSRRRMNFRRSGSGCGPGDISSLTTIPALPAPAGGFVWGSSRLTSPGIPGVLNFLGK